MNPHDANPLPIEPELLDLLADGELSEAQRRELLLRLEDAPGGWRQCALAFLEAQSWRCGMKDVAQRAQSQPQPAAVAQSVPLRRRSRRWYDSAAGRVAAMAAAFLVALGIGLFARTARHDDGRQPQQLAANPQPQPNAQGPTLASAPALPSSAPAVAPPGGSPWKTVTVSLNDGGGQRQIRLPAAQREQLDPAWLEQPMALPAEFQELQETLRAAGCRIEQSRRLVPLPMQDGGRLVVPVDQVEVRYVGDNQYK